MVGTTSTMDGTVECEMGPPCRRGVLPIARTRVAHTTEATLGTRRRRHHPIDPTTTTTVMRHPPFLRSSGRNPRLGPIRVGMGRWKQRPSGPPVSLQRHKRLPPTRRRPLHTTTTATPTFRFRLGHTKNMRRSSASEVDLRRKTRRCLQCLTEGRHLRQKPLFLPPSTHATIKRNQSGATRCRVAPPPPPPLPFLPLPLTSTRRRRRDPHESDVGCGGSTARVKKVEMEFHRWRGEVGTIGTTSEAERRRRGKCSSGMHGRPTNDSAVRHEQGVGEGTAAEPDGRQTAFRPHGRAKIQT